MSDNRRRFVAIYKAIKELYPVEPRGNLVRHLTTLAMLISGIVASKRVNLPAIVYCRFESETNRPFNYVRVCPCSLASFLCQ